MNRNSQEFILTGETLQANNLQSFSFFVAYWTKIQVDFLYFTTNFKIEQTAIRSVVTYIKMQQKKRSKKVLQYLSKIRPIVSLFKTGSFELQNLLFSSAKQ